MKESEPRGWLGGFNSLPEWGQIAIVSALFVFLLAAFVFAVWRKKGEA